MENRRTKNPPDSPGDLCEWRGNSNKQLRVLDFKQKQNTWTGDEIVPFCDLYCESSDRNRKCKTKNSDGCGHFLDEHAEVSAVVSSVEEWVQVEQSWKMSAKLNLMSGASKSDLAQHVTQRSVAPEVHPTYYLITGLNYRYGITCPRRFPFGNS